MSLPGPNICTPPPRSWPRRPTLRTGSASSTSRGCSERKTLVRVPTLHSISPGAVRFWARAARPGPPPGPRRSAREELDPSLGVDAFLSRFTSEDNASFQAGVSGKGRGGGVVLTPDRGELEPHNATPPTTAHTIQAAFCYFGPPHRRFCIPHLVTTRQTFWCSRGPFSS